MPASGADGYGAAEVRVGMPDAGELLPLVIVLHTGSPERMPEVRESQQYHCLACKKSYQNGSVTSCHIDVHSVASARS